jgi:recombination protein RecA
MATPDLAKLMSTINKAYGKQKVFPASLTPPVRRVPTGNPAFDYITGGGFPVNRITELIGPESSGKTYHALLATTAFQKVDWSDFTINGIESVEWAASSEAAGKKKKTDDGDSAMLLNVPKTVVGTRRRGTPKVKRVVWIDTEGTFDPDWAAHQGVDLEGLLYYQPDTLNEAVDIAYAFISHPDIGLVVFDSMSAVGAESEMEASMEKDQMGVNARFWNRAIRKFQAALNQNPSKDTTLIVVNTLTTKLGIMFGNPESPRNGNQIKYAKSLSVESRGLKIQGEEDGAGRNFKLKVLKSKVCPPFRESNYFLDLDPNSDNFGYVDVVGAMTDLATSMEIVHKSGAWYSYEGLKVQGFEAFKDALAQTPATFDLLKRAVYSKF